MAMTITMGILVVVFVVLLCDAIMVFVLILYLQREDEEEEEEEEEEAPGITINGRISVSRRIVALTVATESTGRGALASVSPSSHSYCS
jgi:hypothetical protein